MESEYLNSIKKIAAVFDVDRHGNILFNNAAISPEYNISNKIQLADKLAGFIYSTCYCRTGDRVAQVSERELAKINDENFMGQICAADTGNYQPSEKWRVNGYIPNSDPVLSKGTDSFSVNYTETVMQHQGPYQQETAYATIKNTRHKFSEKNSFYYIFSDNPESKKNALLLRFYWNIRPAGIAMLINRLTAGLNRHYIPFQFKCLKHPDLYTRSDACVLYIFPKYLHITCQVIKNFIGEIQPYLKADTPMLTLRLCDGLSFAESPAGGKSFGMQHSKMLSYCLITAFEQGMSVEQKVSHIINIYNAMGYSVEEIYKNPGSIFNYTFLNKILN